MRAQILVQNGFTLVETLVVIVVMGILIGTLVPAVASARAESTSAKCGVNMRSAGTLLSAYSVDYRDALPFGGFKLRSLEVPEIGKVGIGARFGLGFGAWAFLFPEQWSGRDWNSALRCPLQPAYDGVSTIESWEGVPTPMYDMASAVWLDEAAFAASRPINFRESVQPHQLSDVAFPSMKGYLIENPGFCAKGAHAQQDILSLRQTYVQPVSVLLFDGSVIRRAMKDMRGYRRGLPVITTEDGIRGRDL